MTRRHKIIIAIVLIIVAIILFFLFFFRNRQESPPPATIIVTEPVVEPVAPKPEVLPVTPEQKQERIDAAGLTALAKTFAERYGSYANEANYANIRDVLPLMSSAFKARSESMLENATPPQGFYAVTTKVISINVDLMDEAAGQATVSVSTQREEATDAPQNLSVRYQTIVLTFIKEAQEWKVDSAKWQ